jgi:hypothetical protein
MKAQDLGLGFHASPAEPLLMCPVDLQVVSLLETYRFHPSHSLAGSQRRINDLPTVSTP